MKILFFDNLEYNSEYADFVKCMHFDNDGNKADAMLVPVGNEFCPICGEETIWADADHERYEVSISEVFETEEIVHTDANFREEYNDMTDESKLIAIK